MNVIVVTPVRLMGDGLASCVKHRTDIVVSAIVSDLAALRHALLSAPVDVILIDVTHGINLYDVRTLVSARPAIAFIALGLTEQRQEVIRCGRAGFSGYIARDASVVALCDAMINVVAGRLACPAEISGGLLRALFQARHDDDSATTLILTPRQRDVLRLIGLGMSNKEIARKLNLSVATVKHHVHVVLEKLGLPRRAQAMQRVRDAPWIAAPAAVSPHESPQDLDHIL